MCVAGGGGSGGAGWRRRGRRDRLLWRVHEMACFLQFFVVNAIVTMRCCRPQRLRSHSGGAAGAVHRWGCGHRVPRVVRRCGREGERAAFGDVWARSDSLTWASRSRVQTTHNQQPTRIPPMSLGLEGVGSTPSSLPKLKPKKKT